jgi:hypothetical protein
MKEKDYKKAEKFLRYEDLKKSDSPIVHVIQHIPGTAEGRPKINIMGASEYGKFKFLLPELSQIIFSPGPLIFRLRKELANYKKHRLFIINR